MTLRTIKIINIEPALLDYDHAGRIVEVIRQSGSQGSYCLDCRSVTQVTTAALAHLIALRSQLRDRGSELFLHGLHGQARSIYEVHKMHHLLPQIELAG